VLCDPVVLAQRRCEDAGTNNYAYSSAIADLDAAVATTPVGVVIKLERLQEFLRDAAEGAAFPFKGWSRTAQISESISASLTHLAMTAAGIA
jgi:hypothetical protein